MAGSNDTARGADVSHLYKGVEISIERIGPEAAKEMLECNVDNRSPKKSALAKALEDGEWQLNGETIVFSDTGRLIDGQNRLIAVIKTGVPIDTIVVSTQHDPDVEQVQIRRDVEKILLPRVVKRLPKETQKLFDSGKGKHASLKLYVNPTGKFVIGGPHGDTGLTGRKIIVDTYGGRGAHGGGAFSGKDSSKVDRSAAYATRHIAKNLVGAGLCDECLVQVAYAIGVAEPVGLYVNTYGTAHVAMTDGEIAEKVKKLFDLRPYAIVERFGLKNPIFQPTAAYGHMGRDPYEAEVTVYKNGKPQQKTVQFFGWEKLDMVDAVKKGFQL